MAQLLRAGSKSPSLRCFNSFFAQSTHDYLFVAAADYLKLKAHFFQPLTQSLASPVLLLVKRDRPKPLNSQARDQV